MMGVAMLALSGCRQPVATSAPATKPTGSIRIERSADAEAALAALGWDAWVFKHSGGELTADFKIMHRPAGADAQEEVVFSSSGDSAVSLFQAEYPDKPPGEIEGLIVAAVPDGFEQGKGSIQFAFNLLGASTSLSKSSDSIVPEPFSSEMIFRGWTSGGIDRPIELAPGETVVLHSREQRVWTEEGASAPMEHRELFRISLTATALKDGEIPADE